MATAGNATHREPWNKGKLVGQKAPFKLKDIWALRVRLQMEGRVRELPTRHDAPTRAPPSGRSRQEMERQIRSKRLRHFATRPWRSATR